MVTLINRHSIRKNTGEINSEFMFKLIDNKLVKIKKNPKRN
jgi:hypothetical protein